MSDRGTVTINGQQYDAVSGLPVTEQTPSPSVSQSVKSMNDVVPRRAVERISQSNNPHSRTQRSTTLNRKFTKKPTPIRTTINRHRPSHTIHHDIVPAPQTERSSARNPHVRKFAPHPIDAVRSVDAGPVSHPHVEKAHARSAAKEAHRRTGHLTRHVAASDIKQASTEKAIADAKPTLQQHKPRFWQHKQRATGIIAASFALVLLGGYFTYLNMPSLSVRVAAAQAGIDADYPNYRPDGYALNGPVTFSDGRVSMNFKANASDSSFTVSQSKSSWNSEAVLDNYVTPRAGESYMPYTERGLTIYTYDNSAAWVNGGILYTIEGDAPLSSQQIRQIATSLL